MDSWLAFQRWIAWADASGWFGFVGLSTGAIGFAVTLCSVWLGAKAATQAKRAAEEAVSEVQKLRGLSDLSAAVSELEEVKRFARSESWVELPDRLSRARKLLIGARAKELNLTDEAKHTLSGAIAVFTDAEKHITKNGKNLEKINAPKMNNTIIDEVDRLVDLISRIS